MLTMHTLYLLDSFYFFEYVETLVQLLCHFPDLNRSMVSTNAPS